MLPAMHYRNFLVILWTALLFCSACASTNPAATPYGPRGFWKPNRYDQNGLSKGRWRTYYDDANKQPFTTGCYRHGRPVRTFEYFAPTGGLDHTEKYGRDGMCEVTYWYPSGKVARRGTAQWVTGAKGARFYWYGPWMSYNEDGQMTAVQTYTNGTITRAETYQNGRLAGVEEYHEGKPSRTETYQDGKLLKVETFDKGLRPGTITAPGTPPSPRQLF